MAVGLALGVCSAAVWSDLHPLRYTAAAEVTVPRGDVSQSAVARVQSRARLLVSRPVLSSLLLEPAVAGRLQADMEPHGAIESVVAFFAGLQQTDLDAAERLMRALEQRVDVQALGNGRLAVLFSARDAELARDSVNGVIDAFAGLEKAEYAKARSADIEWIEAEIDRVNRRIADGEAAGAGAADDFSSDRILLGELEYRRDALRDSREAPETAQSIFTRATLPEEANKPSNLWLLGGGALAGLLLALLAHALALRALTRLREANLPTWARSGALLEVPVQLCGSRPVGAGDEAVHAIAHDDFGPLEETVAVAPTPAVSRIDTDVEQCAVAEVPHEEPSLDRIHATVMTDGGSKIAILSISNAGKRRPIAELLGEAAVADGLRSVVVEMVVGDESGRAGMSDLLSGRARFADVIDRHPRGRAHYIGPGSCTVEGTLLAPASLDPALTALENTYDLVLMDMGSIARDEQCIALVSGTNHVALVADPGPDADWVMRLLAMNGVRSVSLIPEEELAASNAA
ncbi:hypothetical protein [Hartmannibacter diazotrophicus]|nr:hypothetical protein [Hartmannibacter diazotrophicus]